MKKLKLFMFVALFGAMSYGAFTAYDYVTMSADEKAFLENIEALTYGEPGGGGGGGNTVTCYSSSEAKPSFDYYDCGNCKKVDGRKGKGGPRECVAN